MNSPKYQEYKGIYFCRDNNTGYYLNSTLKVRMHRYVWEQEVGPIPDGFDVHHIDGDKSNNSIDNLSLLTNRAHQILHGKEESRKAKMRLNIAKAQEAAKVWHSSPEGLAWHSEQGKRTAENVELKEFVCSYCGKKFLSKPFGPHKYCSGACKSADRRASGADIEIRICEICGKEFTTSKYSKTRFCSIECRGKNRSHINEEKRAAGIPVRKGAKTSG